MSIPNNDYYAYKSAIDVANDQKDKQALANIQKELISKYGLDDRDVKMLLDRFRYTV